MLKSDTAAGSADVFDTRLLWMRCKEGQEKFGAALPFWDQRILNIKYPDFPGPWELYWAPGVP